MWTPIMWILFKLLLTRKTIQVDQRLDEQVLLQGLYILFKLTFKLATAPMKSSVSGCDFPSVYKTITLLTPARFPLS